MKIIMFFCALVFAYSFCNAQNLATIVSKNKTPHAGVENLYIYRPPEHILVPDVIKALVVYKNKKGYYNKTVPINKVDNQYQFLFKAPDSTQVLIFGIVDDKGLVIDNNNESGFVKFLYEKNGSIPATARIEAANLLSFYAPHFLYLNKDESVKEAIKLYEAAFQQSPTIKKENYLPYLYILYQEKKDTVKPKLLAYAKEMASTDNDEQKWVNAIGIYQLLKMKDEQENLENKTLAKYPNGQIAIQKFWEKYYANEKTEQSILLSMAEYINRFHDSSGIIKDHFYSNILSLFLDKKEWKGLPKYELLIKNKLAIANIYNNFAWKLSGAELYNAGIDLQTAKALSKKSIDYTAEQMKTPVTDDIARQNLQGTYNNFSDTYGLILFKLGLYDSAFYYQDAIYQQGGQLDAGGLERYAAYAEKVKGSVYTKQVIEQQLLSGVNSPALLKQLQSIYKELNLPNDEFNNIQDKSNQVARQKMEETIKERFGTTEAKNFVLKNIDGQNVSLRSCINKVVVLDFWATWCGPCRASFPATQALINNYKSDSNVVFLFVDVWEHKDAKEMQEAAAKFVKDNNYSFDVLLDTKDKVVDEYKVDGIPTKFVIDKKGEMVFIGNGADDIAGIIEASKK